MVRTSRFIDDPDKIARYWITPAQFQKVLQATQEPGKMQHPDEDEPRTGWKHLLLRDEMMIQLMYDLGLRRGEVARLKVKHVKLDADTPHIYLPSDIQKKSGHARNPSPARMTFSEYPGLQTVQKLRIYLNARWKDSDALFPTQKATMIRPRTVNRRVDLAGERSGVRPYGVDGEKTSSDNLSPHVFRHSVAYRMLVVEEGNTIYDVQKRLRHNQLSTTERIYNHFLMR